MTIDVWINVWCGIMSKGVETSYLFFIFEWPYSQMYLSKGSTLNINAT